MNDIDQQFETFKTVIVEINYYQSFTNSMATRISNYQQILEDNNLIKKRSEMSENDWSSTINFFYNSYSHNQLTLLETSKFTKSDFERIELELKNRQYQFLLLHGFEAFEKYLKQVERLVGTNPTKKKSHSLTQFIMKLHESIPEIPKIIELRSKENSNFLDEINLLLTFSLIEQLRHQITHSHGYAKNKIEFTKKCLERIGRYNNGNPKSEYVNYLNSFFGINKYENLICLLDIRDKDNPQLIYNRLGRLIEELVSYVVFIHPYIKKSLI